MVLGTLAQRSLGLRYILRGYARLVTTPWPLFLTQFVTARCNARCPHCFYWREAEDARAADELSCDEMERICRTIPPLPVVLIGGGEPTLRDDLAALCSPFVHHCSTELIIIPTNGLVPAQVERVISEVLDECRPATIRINLSLDGPEEVHDRIRGAGAYKKLLATRWRLAELARREPRLRVCVNLTLSRLNIDVLEDTVRLLQDPPWDGPPVSVTLVRSHPRDPSVLDLDPEEVDGVLESMRRASRFSWNWGGRTDFLTRAVARAYREGGRIAPCRAGSLEAVISEKGVVHPCEILDHPLGDLRKEEYDFQRIWLGEEAQRVREGIDRGECWCTHETDISNACRFWPPLYPWLLFSGGSR